jgi:hypothetical protein
MNYFSLCIYCKVIEVEVILIFNLRYLTRLSNINYLKVYEQLKVVLLLLLLLLLLANNNRVNAI